MARWKTLLLAGALGCWPALANAQGPTDLGVPALPPGAGSSVSTGTVVSAPARVSVSDRAVRTTGIPDISGMPNPESVQPANFNHFGGGGYNPFCQTVGGNGFSPGVPACQEPCGTTIQASGPGGFLVFGDILWYHVRRNDPVTLTQSTFDDGLGNVSTTSNQSNFSTGNGIGYRFGLGYLMANGWYGTVSYTHYKDTVASKQIDATLGNADPNITDSLFYIGPGPLGSGAGGDASGGILDYAFHLKYQMVDLMGSTVISPASCLDLHVGGGLRAGVIDQRYTASIDQSFTVGSTSAQDLFSRIRVFGPRIGGEARWYPLAPLTLYAKAYTSMLYSYRKESATLTLTDLINGTSNVTVASYNREDVIPAVELTAGADLSLFNNRVLIGAGYEFNYLFGAGSTFTEQASNPRSGRQTSLVIDGLNVHLTILF